MANGDKSNPNESTALLGQAPPPYAFEASSSSSTPLTPQPQRAPSSPLSRPPPNVYLFISQPNHQQQQRFMGPSPIHTLPFAELDARRAVAAADRRARRRWVGAMCWGLLIWIGLSWTVGWVVEHDEEVRRAARRGYSKGSKWIGEGKKWGVEHVWGPDGVMHRWDTSDIDGVVRCAHFSSPSFATRRLSSLHPLALVYAATAGPTTQTSTTSFRIPIGDVEELFFAGSGGWTAGQVQLSVDSSLSNEAVVQLVATHDDAQLLADAHVCQVADKKTAGLVIRTPSRYNVPTAPNTLLNFKLEVALPASMSASVAVRAHEFAVSGAIPSLGSGKLEIITANQPIDLTEDVVASSILLSTSNAVVSTLALQAQSVVVKSSNGELRTTALDARSAVYTTSNKPIDVALSTAFSGKVLATTSNEAVALFGPRTKKQDGLDRHLEVKLRTPSATEAEVYWGEQLGGDKLSAHTSNAAVRVEVL